MGGLAVALSLADAGFKDIEVYEAASDLGFVGSGIQVGMPFAAQSLDSVPNCQHERASLHLT